MSEIIVKFKEKIIEEIPLNKQTISIGRTPSNDIVIDNPSVSQVHAKVTYAKGQFIVEDNKSMNGTFVNGKKITKYILKDKDEIKIGKHILELSIDKNSVDIGDESTQDFYDPPALDAGGTVILDTKHHRELLQQNLNGNSGVFSKIPKIRVLDGIKTNKDYVLSEDTIRIGTGKKCLVKLQGFLITGKQAIITKTYSGYTIKHTGGWRPTKVNGRAIIEVPLGNNDIIQVGRNRLQFIIE
jgi:pSer/pThr/pTyr-binding forkhead associated (FHA) protein